MEKIYEILMGLHPEYDYESSDNFVEDGYLDSFDIVSLVSELEETFSITIDGMAIIPENFVSFGSILSLVKASSK